MMLCPFLGDGRDPSFRFRVDVFSFTSPSSLAGFTREGYTRGLAPGSVTIRLLRCHFYFCYIIIVGCDMWKKRIPRDCYLDLIDATFESFRCLSADSLSTQFHSYKTI